MTGAEQGGVVSVGSIGIELRSDDRLYATSRRVHRGLSSLHRLATRASDYLAYHPDITRCVGRFFVTEETIAAMDSDAPHWDMLEGIQPVERVGGDDQVSPWQALGAVNSPMRAPLCDLPRVIAEVQSPRSHIPPVDRIRGLRDRGVTFLDRIPVGIQASLQELWNPVFGWSTKDIQERAAHIEKDVGNGANRRSWVSIALHGNTVMAAAVIEGLDVVLPTGACVTLFESSEWCSRTHGYASGAVAHVTAQWVRDYIGDADHPMLPARQFIHFAEANIGTRAFLVGETVGLERRTIPEMRKHHPWQVLRQNVTVNGQLQDFLVMSFPWRRIEELYGADAVQDMLEGGRV